MWGNYLLEISHTIAIVSVSDNRKIKNPRINSRHKEEMMSGLRPQKFVRESKLPSNPHFRKMLRSRPQNFLRENELLSNSHLKFFKIIYMSKMHDGIELSYVRKRFKRWF